MAFVNQSPTKFDLSHKSAADLIGPGQYDVDSTQHKQLMAALYPKKTAPFNGTEGRMRNAQNLPSPGKILSSFLRHSITAFICNFRPRLIST